MNEKDQTMPISTEAIKERYLDEKGLNLPEYKEQVPSDIKIFETRTDAQKNAEEHGENERHTLIFEKDQYRCKDCATAWRWNKK